MPIKNPFPPRLPKKAFFFQPAQITAFENEFIKLNQDAQKNYKMAHEYTKQNPTDDAKKLESDEKQVMLASTQLCHLLHGVSNLYVQTRGQKSLASDAKNMVTNLLNESEQIRAAYLTPRELKQLVADTIKYSNACIRMHTEKLEPGYFKTLEKPFDPDNIQLNSLTFNYDTEKDVLGAGAFGIVYKYEFTDETDPVFIQLKAMGICNDIDRCIAVKTFKVNETTYPRPTAAQIENALQEMKTEGNRGDALLKGYISLTDPHVNPTTLATLDGNPVVISQLLHNSDARKYIEKKIESEPSINREEFAYHLIKDLISSLSSMHYNTNQPMIHGDIAARNLFIDANGKAVLGDLGWAAEIGSEKTATVKQDLNKPHPIKWLPSEVNIPDENEKGTASRSSDCYSSCVTILEILAMSAGITDSRKIFSDLPYGGKAFVKMQADMGNEFVFEEMFKTLNNLLEENIKKYKETFRDEHPHLPPEEVERHFQAYHTHGPERQISNLLHTLKPLLDYDKDKTTTQMQEQLAAILPMIEERIQLTNTFWQQNMQPQRSINVEQHIKSKIKNDPSINREELAYYLINDLITSLYGMHYDPNQPTVHRDIVAKNLFVNPNGNAFLCHKGNAATIGPEETAYVTQDLNKPHAFKWLPSAVTVHDENSMGKASRSTDCYSASVTMLAILAMSAGIDDFRQIFDSLPKNRAEFVNLQMEKGDAFVFEEMVYGLDSLLREKLATYAKQFKAANPNLSPEDLDRGTQAYQAQQPEGQILNLLWTLKPLLDHDNEKTTQKMWDQLNTMRPTIEGRIQYNKDLAAQQKNQELVANQQKDKSERRSKI